MNGPDIFTKEQKIIQECIVIQILNISDQKTLGIIGRCNLKGGAIYM